MPDHLLCASLIGMCFLGLSVPISKMGGCEDSVTKTSYAPWALGTWAAVSVGLVPAVLGTELAFHQHLLSMIVLSFIVIHDA